MSLGRGHWGQPLAYVEQILDYLEATPLAGADEPFRVYQTCCQVLSAVPDSRAPSTLVFAYDLLQEWAASNEDRALRRSFLEHVAAHREIVAAHPELGAHQGGCQPEVRLPRTGATTGRALKDDEYVSVKWTVDAPEDEGIAGKMARRHHRLLRLCWEAAEQDAAPTVDDLAVVLKVSQGTIKRDLAALRQAGHIVRTRDSREW